MQPKMTAKDAADFLNISLQAINKNLKSKDVEFKKSANRLHFGHDASRTLFNLKIDPQIIAFQIVKGGTGKTAIALNFAIRASLYGLRVLCLDLDQQGNLTDLLGVDGEEYAPIIDCLTDDKTEITDLIINVMPGIDLIPSNLDNALLENTLLYKKLPLDKVYARQLQALKDRYDVIVLDCPPALGANNAAAVLASDLVVAVVDPDRNAVKGLKYTYEEVTRMEKQYERRVPVKIVLNKFDKRTSLSHDTLESLIKHKVFGPMLCKTYVGVNQQFPNASAMGGSIFDPIKESSAKVDIDLLTREILGLDRVISARKEKALHSPTAELSI